MLDDVWSLEGRMFNFILCMRTFNKTAVRYIFWVYWIVYSLGLSASKMVFSTERFASTFIRVPAEHLLKSFRRALRGHRVNFHDIWVVMVTIVTLVKCQSSKSGQHVRIITLCVCFLTCFYNNVNAKQAFWETNWNWNIKDTVIT